MGQLRLTRRLTAVRQIVRLALIPLLGLVYLLGGPIEARLGSFSFTIAILASLGIGLTLLEVIELLGGSSERGGTFDLVAETMGGLASFLTGWSLLAAETLLVAALIIPAWQLVQTGINLPLPNWLGSLILLVLLAITQLFPFDRRRRFRNLVANLLMVGLAVLLVGAVLSPGWRFPAETNMVRAADLWQGAARLGLMYLLLESVLVARRQMRRERVSIIRSMLWVMAAGGTLVGLVYLVVSGFLPQSGPLSIWQNMLALNRLSEPLVGGVILFTLLLSARAVLTLASRNIYDMSRLGALPRALRTARRPFSAPPLLVLAPVLPITCWFLLQGIIPILEIASGLFLAVAIFVNIAGIYSRRAEPERRRKLTLPLFPLFPAIAITVILSFYLNLNGRAQAFSLGWLLLGIPIYFFYAQRRQVEAQEGLTLFVGDRRLVKEEGTYRILVPLAEGEHRHFILQLAVGLAKQLNGDVMPLQVIPVPDPLAMDEARRLAKERNTLFNWSTRLASQAGVAIHPITRLARTVPEGILDTAVEEDADLLLIPWAMADDPEIGQMGAVLDPVIAQASCDTAVVAYKSTGKAEGAEPEKAMEASIQTINRILVPTAGGPHAPLAVGLGLLLAKEFKAQVSSVYVAETSASDAEIKAGEDRIRATLLAMEERAAEALHQDPEFSLLDGTEVESRVILADDVVAGITEASQDADLALIGSSEESLVDQVLFGNLPRRVAAACKTPIIMVRRYRGLPRFWLHRLWTAAYQAFPTLDDSEKIDVYIQVRRGARPKADFFVMMAVASFIATIGLLQGSAAVIIGSMLVAPLFTPILAISLGIAQGDIRLIRVALESMLKGVVFGIAVATIAAWISPLTIITDEILLRSRPNLFDLAVALAAGVAGAYAVARKEVAAALPGVAIAAALVPPLGVLGIGLSIGDLAMAGGATLLILTNLIAIVLTGAITLLLLGFRPGHREEREVNLRRGLVLSVILLLVIAVPLAIFFGQAIQQTRIEQQIRQEVETHYATIPYASFVDFEFDVEVDHISVEVTVWAEQSVPEQTAADLAGALNDAFGRQVELRILAVQIDALEARSE